MASLTDEIRARAHQAGFDLAGVTGVRPAPLAEMLQAWLERGMHGTMRYMEDPEGRRADLQVYLPWARSLVVVGLSYFTPHEVSADPERGAISRYAWGRDYHREVRARLETLRAAVERLAPGCRTHPFVDTSPVLEKGVAEAAGLGWRGKHTNLLRERSGSWFFLGGLATDLDLDGDPAAKNRCGTCTRCIDVCPTGAIVVPYVLDARLCIAYITIELRGPIPRQLRPRIGNRIFGCDDCQDVCPWNRFAQATRVEGFEPRDGNLNPLLVDLMGLTRPEWNRRFKTTAIRRAHYEGFLRNVAVALGNWSAPEALPALANRLGDGSALVRGHVAWALGRIATPEAMDALERRRDVEDDDGVREEIDDALARQRAAAGCAAERSEESRRG
ncbi:MAG: tRNA epoxyqueuosine(34) reductase QueG [Candidatus Krumholzibacteriia bacterium]